MSGTPITVLPADGVRSTPASASARTAGDTVHVLFCANRTYFQHMAVAALSVVEASRRPHIHVHVMTCDHHRDAEDKLVETLRPYANARVTIHHVSDERLATLFVDKYLTKEAYLRFLAPDILPDDVSRVIYLDSDLVVLDDIGSLWDVGLAGNPLAAAPDLDWWGDVPERRLLDLGLRPGHRYINSGVLVMDLAAWRREGISARLFAFAAQQGARLTYHDQDALNVVLQDRITLLARRWNVQTLWYTRFVRTQFPQEFRATAEIRRRPAILHFSTKHKPWKFRVWTRKKAVYFRFLARTAWRDELPPGLTDLERLEYRATRVLLRTGLDVYVMAGIWQRVRLALARLRSPVPGTAAHEDGR